MKILLDAPDWVTGSGIRRVLEQAGYDVLFSTDTVRLGQEAETFGLGVLAVEDGVPPGSKAAVSLCASRDVPVVWWCTDETAAHVVDIPSVRTVGILITPVHETQLLAAVKVGLAVGRLTQGATLSAAEPSALPRSSARDRYSEALGRLPLTTRQRAIVEMMLDGDRVSTIAEALEITPATVRAHLNRIYGKLGVRSQATLVRALKAGSGTDRDPSPAQ